MVKSLQVNLAPPGVAPNQPTHDARRVLLVVTGLTPQVLTETVWALVNRPKPWVPTDIHVLTTVQGKMIATQKLLGRNGPWSELVKTLSASGLVASTFTEDNVHVAQLDGIELQDITDEKSNSTMADLIVRVVAEWTSKPGVELHVSMAGGRKTMSYLAGQAMNLLGRAQDQLSHVLLSWPDESVKTWIDSKPIGRWSLEAKEFFYPGYGAPELEAATLDGKRARVCNVKACVQLTDVPFLRLRDLLPPSLRAKVDEGFSALIRSFNRAMFDPPVMTFMIATKTIDCNGIRIPLQPAIYSMLLLIARRESYGVSNIPNANDVLEYLTTFVSVLRNERQVNWENLTPEALASACDVIEKLAIKRKLCAPVPRVVSPNATVANSPLASFTEKFSYLKGTGKSNILLRALELAHSRFALHSYSAESETTRASARTQSADVVWKLPVDVTIVEDWSKG